MRLTIGERIKDERVKRKWTITQVCEMIREKYGYKLSIGKYTEMEGDDETDFGYKSFVYLARLFEVSTDYLLGVTDVRSTQSDMKTACKTTGLSEVTIMHLKSLCENDKYRGYPEAVNDLICTIHKDLLFHINLLSVIKFKRNIFEKELLKKFRDVKGLEILDDDIDDLGELVISNNYENRAFFKYVKETNLIEYSKIDSDLSKDINYEEYIISKQIHEIITKFLANPYRLSHYSDLEQSLREYYHNALLIKNDEIALDDYIAHNRKKIDRFTEFRFYEEDFEHGEHYPTSE